MNKNVKSFAELENSLQFKEKGKQKMPEIEIKMADIDGINRKYLDIEYCNESKAQCMDIYLPDEGEGPFPLLLHIHGGGFGMGDKRDDHMNPYLQGLSHGYAIGSIEYRLSGEAIFPAAVLDCREAIRFIRNHAEEYGIDPDRIGVLGGSAGGNLSAILAMNIPNGEFIGEEGKEFVGSCAVKAAVDQFGPIDFAVMDDQARANGISFADHNRPSSAESSYMGGAIETLDTNFLEKSNPIHYISKAMAPMLVEHGCMDRLVPFMQSVELVHAIYEKLGRGYVEFVPLPTADHEDKQYSEKWNMDILWKWLDENLK